MILDPQLGIRVALTGDHPWRGQSGELVRWERASFSFGPLPVVLLDNEGRPLHPTCAGPA